MLSQPVGYFFLWSINGTFKSFVGVMLGFGCVSFFGIAGAARSTGAVVPTGFTIGAVSDYVSDTVSSPKRASSDSSE